MAVTVSGTDGVTTPGLTLNSAALDVPSGSAPSYLCRAWVNFNGQGTIAIRASGNVSSITDNGTGNYTVNAAVAMADSNFLTLAFCREDYSGVTIGNVIAKGFRAEQTTTASRIQTFSSSTNFTALDSIDVYVVFLR
jgi:hypothetical protein